MISLNTTALSALLVLSLYPASLPAQASTVLLVRHAEKADTSADSDLSVQGQGRAAELGTTLANFPLTAVYVTQYKRTRQTADPTLRLRQASPVVVPVTSDLEAHIAAIARAVRALPAGSTALVVGHSNTLSPIIAALGGPAMMSNLCDGEFSTLFIMEFPGGSATPRLLRAKYGAPDPPDANGCQQQMRIR